MTRQTLRICAFILAFLIVGVTAAGDGGPVPCRIYRAGDSPPSKQVADLLQRFPDGAVEICTIDGAKRHYVHSKPVVGSLGGCYAEARRVFENPGEPASDYWTYFPKDRRRGDGGIGIRAFMTEGAGGCPGPADPKYMAVQNVSEGAFLIFSGFWKRASSSISAFEAASNFVPREEKVGPAYKSLAGEISRAATLEGDSVRLTSIGIIGGVNPPIRPPSYTLEVRTPRGLWLVHADLSEAGPRLLGVTTAE
jgi:hypothetical protein